MLLEWSKTTYSVTQWENDIVFSVICEIWPALLLKAAQPVLRSKEQLFI